MITKSNHLGWDAWSGDFQWGAASKQSFQRCLFLVIFSFLLGSPFLFGKTKIGITKGVETISEQNTSEISMIYRQAYDNEDWGRFFAISHWLRFRASKPWPKILLLEGLALKRLCRDDLFSLWVSEMNSSKIFGSLSFLTLLNLAKLPIQFKPTINNSHKRMSDFYSSQTLWNINEFNSNWNPLNNFNVKVFVENKCSK